eukprot:TRINITY_DN4129_c0_g1_i1.p1 TRINITY_DN4129_c0_g1~~TRINITY_DN4129_c0_g1_i1.p1  ORF type:complete len:256 (-),score=35.55 TRINITY_DN4129_c0_g1_i1:54-821(-)
MESKVPNKPAELSYSYRLVRFSIAAALVCFAVYSFFHNGAILKRSFTNHHAIKVPTTLEELKDLGSAFDQLKFSHQNNVILFFVSLYIMKQTFSLPGAALLNILAGRMFGGFYGFLIASALTAIGASCCYLMTDILGRRIIQRIFSGQIKKLADAVEKNRSDLFYYMIFLRIVPVVPQWLVNIASPLINVPLYTFMPAIFFGLMPYNFICAQAGGLLAELKSTNDVFGVSTILKLSAIAIAALLPLLLKKKLKKD